MLSLKCATLLLAALGVVQAQIVQVSEYNFDVDGCVAPDDVYNCYLVAQADYVNFGNNYCNNPNVTSPSQRGNCIIAASTSFGQKTIGCMISGCWNRALSCEFQLALAAHRIDGYYSSSGSNSPGFTPASYGNSPGSCVCNIPSAVELILLTPATYCITRNPADSQTCDCCEPAAALAQLQALCPNNSYEPIGLSTFISNTAQAAQSNCGGLASSDWQSTLNAQCPANAVPNDSGYLNVLSLPAGFPATTPLSNIPGSVTAVSQYNYSSTAFVQIWNDYNTQTYTFSAYNAAAVSSTAAGQSLGVITASSGAVPTTGITLGGKSGQTTATTTTSGTNTASAAQTSKTGGVERLAAPGVVGLLPFLLML